MIDNMFYKGLLAELNKTADYSLPEKKRSFIRNPVLWGSLGLGLAGLGAYKKFNSQPGILNHPTPSPTPTPAPVNALPEVAGNSVSALDNVVDKANIAGLAGGAGMGTGSSLNRLYKWMSGRELPGVGRVRGFVNGPVGKTTGKVLGGGLDALFGAQTMEQGIKNTDQVNNTLRGTQIAGGAAQTGLGVLGAFGRQLPSAATRAFGRGAILEAAPTSAASFAAVPFVGAQLVRGELGWGAEQANSHSSILGRDAGADPNSSNYSDAIVNVHRLLNSHNPGQVNFAKNFMKDLVTNHSDKVDAVTNPGGWARIGYNPVPNKWYNPSAWVDPTAPFKNNFSWYNPVKYLKMVGDMYNPFSYINPRNDQDPDFSSFNHNLERVRREAQMTPYE